MPSWLAVSIILSVVLTVALNLWLRAFPGAGQRMARRLEELVTPNEHETRGREPRVRVFFPWKAMIIGSIILTVVINVVLRLG